MAAIESALLQRGGMCLAESRPSVQLMYLLRFLTGAALCAEVAGDNGHLGRTAWGAVAWMTMLFAIYLFNGVTDLEEDRLNGSGRPIARGDLEPGLASSVAVCTALLSLVAGFALSPVMGGMLVAMLVLGYLYSGPPFPLKRSSAGTVFTGFAATLLTYFGGVFAHAGQLTSSTMLIVFVVAASLWTALVGSTAKDLPDIEGDAQAGRATFAVVHGERVLRRAITLVALGLAVAFTVVILVLDLPLWSGALAMLAGAAVIAVLCAKGFRREPYGAFMATQYALHGLTILPLA
ncbi:UbiA family prenyltransferase [Nonomuraea sp. NPDC049480]|uniref:UbiA family prenyltransferase n=1 Tax=Nonomuraea sp. NPDC049480 TaxID=3364353 RepID=UPI0037A80479